MNPGLNNRLKDKEIHYKLKYRLPFFFFFLQKHNLSPKTFIMIDQKLITNDIKRLKEKRPRS